MLNQPHALIRRNGGDSRPCQLGGCGRSPTKPWKADRLGPPRPFPSGKKPRKPKGLFLVFFERRLPKSAVMWQNWNLSFRILEEDTMDRLDAMSTFLAVVEAGSLSAAGGQMKRPPPTA